MTSAPLAEYPKTIVLVDGAHLVLRPVAAGDRDALTPLLADVSSADRHGAGLEHADPIVLAWEGERLAGAIGLVRRADVARLGIALATPYRARRLGTWMLLDVVHLAASLGCTSLEAPVGADDARFRAALHRLDFVPASADPRDTVLVKTLHAAWTDF